MSWFCKHDWEVADKQVREPAIQTIDHTVDRATLATAIAVPALAVGRVVWLLRCTKCTRTRIEASEL